MVEILREEHPELVADGKELKVGHRYVTHHCLVLCVYQEEVGGGGEGLGVILFLHSDTSVGLALFPGLSPQLLSLIHTAGDNSCWGSL